MVDLSRTNSGMKKWVKWRRRTIWKALGRFLGAFETSTPHIFIVYSLFIGQSLFLTLKWQRTAVKCSDDFAMNYFWAHTQAPLADGWRLNINCTIPFSFGSFVFNIVLKILLFVYNKLLAYVSWLFGSILRSLKLLLHYVLL